MYFSDELAIIVFYYPYFWFAFSSNARIRRGCGLFKYPIPYFAECSISFSSPAIYA